MPRKTRKKTGKAEDTFSQFGKKVDSFVAELNEASDRLRKEFKGRVQELKKSASKAREQARDKKRWKEVEDSLRKAADELKKAAKAAFKKKG